MLSSFLKKLLFARQFYMVNGNIEVLGRKQIMLPSDIIFVLEKMNEKKAYDSVKVAMKNDLQFYARKLGSNGEGMLKNIDDIFETFGLGQLRIMNLDSKSKKCIVRVHHAPTDDGMPQSTMILPAVVAGTFSFLFSKNVNATQTARNSEFLEFVVK